MQQYSYRAKDRKGNTVTGEVEARTKHDAARLIRGKNLVVISVKARRKGLSFLKKQHVKQSEVVSFTRQFATMINSGLTVTESLTITRSQFKGPMHAVSTQLLADVEAGQSLSKALDKHPDVFNKTYVSLVKSGEIGGVLDKVLEKLADTVEKQQTFSTRTKTALIYPSIIVLGMVIVGVIMIVFVVPKLVTLYSEFDATLPLTTRGVIALSAFITKFWPVILLIIGMFIYTVILYRRTSEGREKTDGLMLKLPMVGELYKQVLLTQVTRTLSLMVGSGVSILEGINVSAEVTRNKVVAKALAEAGKLIEKGFPVSYSFAKRPEVFPYLLAQMISVGEETGKMDEVLAKVSHIFETESENKLKGLTTALEPLIMIVLGIGVAVLVVSVVLPIFNLSSQIT